MMAIKRMSSRGRGLKQSLAGIVLASVFMAAPAWANNLQLTNLSVLSTDTAANTMTMSFDLSQDNSWRNTTNYDAAWVFVKYSTDGGVTWNHATMAASGTNPVGFLAPNHFQIVVPSDETGFFVQRSDVGSGNIALKGVQFTWDYGRDGLTMAQAEAANTLPQIFGLEMVYIPQGAFYAGDGNNSSDSSSNYKFQTSASDHNPWYIQSENAISGHYYQNTGAKGDEYPTGNSLSLSASFPKGYGGFYLMKYELTEGQWVDFFNTLSNTAKLNHDITSVARGGKNSDGVVNRNTISWDSGNPDSKATTLRPSRPVSYVSWPDVAAYAAWAGLRPITELEYEKAARGSDITPVANEMAWGTGSYTSPSPGDIYPDAAENGAEIINSQANINNNSLGWTSGDGLPGGIAPNQPGPLRAGIFAANAQDRIQAGAGYYGNMELSGNLAEPVVTVGRAEGARFLGSEGAGTLTAQGYAANADWPGFDANKGGVDETIGMGYRGGDFHSSGEAFQVSSRTYAAKDPDSQGCLQRFDPSCGVFQGGRLGRTAP